MKIKKNKLLEKVLTETDVEKETTLDQIDPAVDSVDKIAKGLQGSIDKISNGESEISDISAQQAASEIKEIATELEAGNIAFDDSVADDEEEILGVENELTHKLDLAYKTAKRGKRQGTNKNANILVTGLPGSGKTSIVYDWAGSGKNINIFSVSAADPDLETAVYGLTLRDTTVTDKNKTTKASSDFLAPLDKPDSVLFLDEFNRANSKLRRALLQLVNEHSVADPSAPKGIRKFPNLLFTVACVNPGGLRIDKNAEALNDAEKSRFAIKTTFDSNVPTTIDYFTKHFNKLISRLDKNSPEYFEDLEEYLRSQDMGIYLVSHPDFNYDTKDDLEDLSDLNRTILNQREITDGLNIAAGDLAEFKDWVENNSEFLDRDIEMILNILNTYIPPRLSDLIKNKEKELAQTLNTKTTDETSSKVEDEDETKAETDQTTTEPENDEEIEDDEDFFGVASEGKTAKTPSEVESIINNAINNW